MNTTISTFIISVLTAGITAIITYFVSTKTNIRNMELELKKEQAFKYFLPLKFSADELFHRLAHIERKLFEKKDMHIQLPQSLGNKNFDWFFTDWKDYNNPDAGAGGYFLTTAILMHAQLYQRINILLKEYPFLEVQVNQSINQYIENSKDAQVIRCYNNTVKDEHTRKWVNIEELKELNGKLKLEKLIKCIRLSAVMKGGIPYGLQPAFGQFIEKQVNGKTEQMNYEEFVRLLMDKEQRVKFSPLHSFYSELVDKDFNIEETKLLKMRTLMLSLLLFRNAELV